MKIVPFRWLVIVRDGGQTVAQYDLTMPEYGSSTFNRSVTAFNEFKQCELARSQSSRVYRRVSFTDWNEAENSKIIRPICKPIATMWALFKAIDYDYTKQEYL